MKKPELISAISDKSGVSKTDIESVLNSLGDVVIENLTDGDIKVGSLGTFKLRVNKARMGQNLKTKEPMAIKESVGVAFKQSATTKTLINGK